MSTADPGQSLSPTNTYCSSPAAHESSPAAAENGPGGDEPLTLLPEVAATGRPAGTRRPFQRRRRSRACDACRARKTKCDTPDSGPCSACAAASLICKFTEGVEDRRRAGPARRIRNLEAQVQDLANKLRDAEARLRNPIMPTQIGYPVDLSTPGTLAPPPNTAPVPPWPGDAGYPPPMTPQQQQQQQQTPLTPVPTYRIFDATPSFLSEYKNHLQNLGYAPAPIPEAPHHAPHVPLLSEYPAMARKNMPTDLRSLLPNKPFADRLLEVFRRTVQSYRPIFYWPMWKQKYDRAWEREIYDTDNQTVKEVFCPLMMVLAVACQMVEPPPEDSDWQALQERQERSGWRFFHIGRKYLDFNTPQYGMNDVLLLHLMSLYLSKASLTAPSCMLSGATSRIAQLLHLDEPPATPLSPPLYEARKRLFWSAFIQDMKMTLLTGVPPAFRPTPITLPLPTVLDLPPSPSSKSTDLYSTSTTESTTAISCLTAQIHTSILLSTLPPLRLTDLGQQSDINTLQSIDESLKRTWELFPAPLTDLQNLLPLEVGALRPLFYLQYARLLLYRFFTEPPTSPLSAAFRNICFAQSVQAAKITAHLITRTGVPRSYGVSLDELGHVHTFRVAVILLVALYCGGQGEAVLPVTEKELGTVVRALEEVAWTGKRGGRWLETFDALAGTMGYVREGRRKEEEEEVNVKMEGLAAVAGQGWYEGQAAFGGPWEEDVAAAAEAVASGNEGIDWGAVQDALQFDDNRGWTPGLGQEQEQEQRHAPGRHAQV